ncbi:MAG: DUF2934 domain-containing protein [Steroidobacteraceae bacterium]|nr:DUF2934 domain-containing protein [Steroidobacteraceae bacterium]
MGSPAVRQSASAVWCVAGARDVGSSPDVLPRLPCASSVPSCSRVDAMNDRTDRKVSGARRALANRKPAVQPPTNSIVTRSSAYVEPVERQPMIAESAYFRSAHRGFEPGHEVDDWLSAESEIDAAMARGDLPRFVG